jgi:hypothetical protein
MFTDTRRIAKQPSSRKLAKIDREIDAIFNRECKGVQIRMLDISKIFEAGRAAALAGRDITEAVRAGVAASAASLGD